MQPVSYRPAKQEDAQFTLNLEEAAMRGYAEALWGSWRPRSTLEEFDPEGVEIILADKSEIGLRKLNRKEEYLFVQRLYLLPEFRRRGIGRAVIDDIKSRATSANLPVQLSVLTTNLDAKRFYEREGFSVIASTPERIRMEWRA
ncbi:N-acetyltransferase [Rhizobium sp. L1K21]|uniref:GNAT family N-acetyltransferase n=1 Tax=Rhizobium sp. L1K21 TaxID=2954933 RepID=UPI002093F060|nr:GNAT family N-acetyltransferase [Rhizobium sp. L1K21]MCO6187210.1 GNAT family N-acetyltransferase [Rhizobium sp. L1K21]